MLRQRIKAGNRLADAVRTAAISRKRVDACATQEFEFFEPHIAEIFDRHIGCMIPDVYRNENIPEPGMFSESYEAYFTSTIL